MANEQPEIVDREESDESESALDRDGESEPDDEGEAPEINEAEAELSEEALEGDLFDDYGDDSEEQESPEPTPEPESDGDSEPDDEGMGDIADGLGGNSGQMESAINDGAARLATVGLTEGDFEESDFSKESLEDEFREVFGAFRLGYFGSQVCEEYIFQPADGDVDPAWGLLGSVCVAGALAIWMRPDGEEQIGALKETLESIGGGA